MAVATGATAPGNGDGCSPCFDLPARNIRAISFAIASMKPTSHCVGSVTWPQNVAIVCKDAASVHVAPLADEDRPNDECLVLRVQAPDLEARFVMYCDADAEDASTGSAAV